jgi:hypothetical protein
MANNSAGNRAKRAGVLALALLLGFPLVLGTASCITPIQFGDEHGIHLGRFGGRRVYWISSNNSGIILLLLKPPPGISFHRLDDADVGVRICIGGIGPGWEMAVW